MDALFAFLGAATVFVLMLQLLGVVFSYKFDEEALSYRFLGMITVGRITYSSIEDVRVASAWLLHGEGIPQDHTMIFAARWPSKVFSRSCVYIRVTNGFPKVRILSPGDAGKFVDEVRKHMTSLSVQEHSKG